MSFSDEDKVLIKYYRVKKGYFARVHLAEFPHKLWTMSGLDSLIRKIDRTESVERKEGSGWPRAARTDEKIRQVKEMISSQKNHPGRNVTPKRIAGQFAILVGNFSFNEAFKFFYSKYNRMNKRSLTHLLNNEL